VAAAAGYIFWTFPIGCFGYLWIPSISISNLNWLLPCSHFQIKSDFSRICIFPFPTDRAASIVPEDLVEMQGIHAGHFELMK
jgi:hypothetical protein